MSGVRKPGILFLEALPTIAGGQTVLVNLIPALRQHYRLAALLPGEGSLATALRAAGVTCFFAPVGRYSLMHKSPRDVAAYAMRLPLLAWRTAQVIRAWDADLVYANSGPTFIWGALAAQLTGCPLVWHHHNLLADGKTLRLVRTTAQLPAVRRIICASTVAQAQFTNVNAKTKVIVNGVDTQRFRPDLGARTRIREELGIPDGARVVGMVGDLIPLKRQDTLLVTIPGLLSEIPDMWIVLVGDVRPEEKDSASYATMLRSMAFPQVQMLGRRDDLPDVLNSMDALVIASERETGPLVLLEALASGVPVVSTPVGYAPALLSADALFPVGDAVALCRCLQSWLADPERLRTAGQQGYHYATELFALERMQDRILAELIALTPHATLVSHANN